jgi:hypothetical protein
MLRHDGDIGTNYAGVINTAGDDFRIAEVIEAHVLCALRRHSDAIRSDRVAIRVVDRDLDVGVLIGSVEDANRFVTGHLRLRPMAFGRNIAFRDDPLRDSNRSVHQVLLLRVTTSSYE